jgi:4'-phosphopantetheinyl transferase
MTHEPVVVEQMPSPVVSSTRGPLQLPQHAVHVWLTRPDQIASEELLQAYERLLSPGETAQGSRLRFESDRHQYLLAHALVRTTLSAYVDIDPRAWRFVRNEFGRPEPLLNQKTPLRFNLSRTAGLIACAVTREEDVGVDVEDLQRLDDPMPLARHAFAASEIADLESLSADDQRIRFFEYWTLKEAWLKGRGVGLSEPLDRAAFQWGNADAGPQLQECVSRANPPWQFRVSRPTSRHVMAVAVRCGSPQQFSIVERWTRLHPASERAIESP